MPVVCASGLSWSVNQTHDITEFCRTCHICQCHHTPFPQFKAPLKPVEASGRFQIVAADFAEMPLTSKGYCYLLVMTNYFSKYINLYAVQDKKATTIAGCLGVGKKYFGFR